MKVFIIALALLSAASADTLGGGAHLHHAPHGDHVNHASHEQHAHHDEHHAVKPEDIIRDTSLSQPLALPVQTYSPAHATPVQTFSEAFAPPVQTLQQSYSQPPPAPAAPVGSYSQYPEDQSYYYYYHPEAPKEKNLWTKIQDKIASLFFSTSRSTELAGSDSTTTWIIIAVVAVTLIVFGPTIIGLLGLTGIMAKMTDLVEKLVAVTTKGESRDIEVNMEDVLYYATQVFEAINKEY